MAILRFALQFSYVLFVVLLICTVLLYDPLDLNQYWLLAMLAPALLLAIAGFFLLPIYHWLTMPTGQKNDLTFRYAIYRLVIAIALTIAPISLARTVLEIPDDWANSILILTIALFILNTGAVLFTDYFVGEEEPEPPSNPHES
jgi:hypothetical protein